VEIKKTQEAGCAPHRGNAPIRGWEKDVDFNSSLNSDGTGKGGKSKKRVSMYRLGGDEGG